MNRRDFIRDTALATMTIAMGTRAVEIRAEARAEDDKDKPTSPPVNCAVIGLGAQGRDMLTSLAKLKGAPITALCDTFTAPNFVKKAKEIAPNAALVEDYRKVLENKDVQAVLIATPTHKHKQIVIDALAAGKHVYCEAPFATDVAEAKAIAQAAKDAKSFFQAGLQVRSNMQAKHVLKFLRASDAGDLTYGRAQWHLRTSWRRPWPDGEREKELNWRFEQGSAGLLGEVGIHQIDLANWYFNALPIAVSGMGGVMGWHDGRTIPDTVQCVLEYPKNVRFVYNMTLTNSFDGAYEMFYGTKAAIQMRDQRAWMFKESDAEDLGWETYARKDNYDIGNAANGTGVRCGTGIALVADATKQLALGKQPGEVGTDVTKTSLYQAIESFLISIRTNKKPEVGALEGYQATVIALKANEAALSNTRIALPPDWLQI